MNPSDFQTFMKRLWALILVFLYLPALPASAQVVDSLAGDAGILFSYNPSEGMEQQFFEGYQSHLKWHRQNGDPFPWYGWTVLSGDRVGMFIDGTFGISYEAFDQRIKPREDAAHFAKSTAPYAEVGYRKVFRLEKTLSTTTRLEEWNPAPYAEVYTFSIIPGRELQFEEVLDRLAEAVRKNNATISYSVYRQLTGGKLPSYLLMVPHDGFAAFGSPDTPTTLSHLIDRLFDRSEGRRLGKQLADCVRDIHGETWLYRQDLSYFPGR